MPSIAMLLKAAVLLLPALASAEGTLGLSLGIHKGNVCSSLPFVQLAEVVVAVRSRPT
jgi:Trk-type K+ transport system membrane component